MKQQLLIYFLTLVCTFSAYGAGVRISVSPQRGKNRIEVGDKFYLNIEVENISENPPRPDNMPGLNLHISTGLQRGQVSHL